MRFADPSPRRTRTGLFLAAAAAVGLAGCGAKPVPGGFNDPDEAKNREIHAFNLAVDKTVVKPLSGGYGGVIPSPLRTGVSNFAQNLDAPGDVVNNVMQGRPQNALRTTLRFVLNTTIGIGGLFDPATELGIDAKPTDFGETLHVWGAGEGAYLVVPFLGPSTERDFVGTIVDAATNPLRLALPKPERNIPTAAKVFSRIGDRARYSETVDSVLYDSADSYAQSRLLYLQNRRFQLGQTTGAAADDDFVDPYEDLYGN